jgi:predicted SprT family Zn-dependent metalloprotease
MDLAWNTYPEFKLAMADIEVVFFPKGSTAGMARWRTIGGVKYFNLEFNISAIALHWDDTYLDTIPHEVAHIVARFIHGRAISAHGPEWVAIAKELGCNGERCHSLKLPRARARRVRKPRHLYTSDGGTDCIVGPNQHTKIQKYNGYYFTINKTGEELYPHNHVRPLIRLFDS